MIPTTKITTQSGIMTSDVYSEEFSQRRIYLTGQIDDALATDICAQINYLSAQSNEDIYVIIQSPGGSVSAGMSILDTMNSCKCRIATIVMGEAASMGALLSSSGNKGMRFIGENAEMMIHQPLGGVSGQASDIERTAVHIGKIKKRIHEMLSKNTGRSLEQICQDCDRDHWLDAEEAIEYGLADAIFTGYKDT